MAAFAKNLDEHIAVYGPENHLRLTGLHETQSIDKFTYGLADRGAVERGAGSVTTPRTSTGLHTTTSYSTLLGNREIVVELTQPKDGTVPEDGKEC
mgnify:CR=1 FL=1